MICRLKIRKPDLRNKDCGVDPTRRTESGRYRKPPSGEKIKWDRANDIDVQQRKGRKLP